jgi:hypothetical protein
MSSEYAYALGRGLGPETGFVPAHPDNPFARDDAYAAEADSKLATSEVNTVSPVPQEDIDSHKAALKRAGMISVEQGGLDG